MAGLVMGAWLLSISCANFLAGKISEYAATVDESKAEIAGGVPMESYYPAYEFLLWYTVIVGGIYLVLSKPLNKWMHGIN